MNVYACGTPIRKHVCRAMAEYLKAPLHEESSPNYRGGDSVFWGLIRGSKTIRDKTVKAGHDYYQLDNGYLGRDAYYRVTKNAFQLTELVERPAYRFEHIAKHHNIKIRPWYKKGTKVLFCLSTEHLYKFMDMDIETHKRKTLKAIKTDREVVVRDKKNNIPIEDALRDAWCVVTHSSAVALDALQYGIPVFTTGPCAAKPCALQDLSRIDDPIYPEREPLFHSLAWGQFLPEEMKLGLAWKCLESLSDTTRESQLPTTSVATVS